ncbi:MAG: S8 family serine peptidase [Gemmatimonadota bacterium]
MRFRLLPATILVFLVGCASAAPVADAPPPAPPASEPAEATPAPDARPGIAPDAGPAIHPMAPNAELPPLEEAPDAWQLLDLEEDRVPGVSATRAYRELLAGRTPQREVVVAVIDGGIDTTHVDLRANLWTNPGETPANGVDDDGNGYVDDVYGWNFIGGADGQNVGHESLEVTRLYVRCEAGETPPGGDSCDEIETAFGERRAETQGILEQIGQIGGALDFAEPVLQRATGQDELTRDVVEGVSSLDQQVGQARALWLQLEDAGISRDILEEAEEAYAGLMEYGLNPDFDARSIVGDDYANGSERVYGNADVMGPDASHGTHVAGIIGAVRGNDEGIDGIGANVRLMTIRTVPDGDERDKDVANAIRYAVDNGAHIINMSFGKTHSPRKELVDAAVRYADEAGVLMVHAAGNDGEDIETADNFPTPVLQDGARSELWIEVGAANWMVDTLAASFSNYGQTVVDVFSPGVDILSTVPGSEYEREDGTSMAAPVVSGVAALLMAYFPNLTAADVKRILLESAIDYSGQEVTLPGSLDGERISFGRLSATGRVVNAYEAVRMALERMQ